MINPNTPEVGRCSDVHSLGVAGLWLRRDSSHDFGLQSRFTVGGSDASTMLGHATIHYVPDREEVYVGLVSIEETLRRKGIGSAIYHCISLLPVPDMRFEDQCRATLVSSDNLNSLSLNLWQSFVARGMARQEGQRYVYIGDRL